MPRSSFSLSLALRVAVYLAFGLLLFTGGAWMLAENRLEETSAIPRLLLKIHGAAAMLALIVLGALTAHIRRGWHARKNHFSGILLLLMNGFLILTGYGLYYAGDENFRAWLSCWHGWIGLGIFVLIPLHVVIGRKIVHLKKNTLATSRR